MKVFVNTPQALWIVRISSILISMSALVQTGAFAYPLNEGSRYTGAIVSFAFLSLIAWTAFTLIALITATYIHEKHSFLRREAWFTVLSGELFFLAFTLIINYLFGYFIKGYVTIDFSIYILIVSLMGGALSFKKAFVQRLYQKK